MKKTLSAILVALMVLTMGTTVFAASPSAGVSVNGAKDKDGNAITLEKQAATQTIVDEAKEEAKSIEGNATVVSTFELKAPEGKVGPYTITVSVAGITSADKVVVLHKASTGWERINATAGNGTVTFTVNSLSPISIVRVASNGSGNSNNSGSSDSSDSKDNSNANTNSNSTSSDSAANSGSNSNSNSGSNSSANASAVSNVVVNTGTSDSTASGSKGSTTVGSNSSVSPKTGEATLPMIPVVALLAMSGLVLCTKKARA